jgi:hypothetical protein
MDVNLDENGLTVQLRGASMAEVLEEIGRRASFEVTFPGSLVKNVSMEFQNLPLDVGLHRLLEGYGRVLVYGHPGTGETKVLERLIILSWQGEGAEHSEAIQQERPQDPVRKLASRLDSEEIKTALADHLYAPEPRVRRDAFLDLIDATEIEDFDILIEMLEDENLSMSDWNQVLAPLSDVMSWWDETSLRIALFRQPERERFAEVLKSHRLFKSRQEAKTRYKASSRNGDEANDAGGLQR